VAEILDKKELTDFKEVMLSEVIQLEALTNLLDKKGIICKQELLEEMKRVKATMVKAEK
jgi:2-phospho-L-lactate guanylyltransferase (CobY/MobA/RfbA family)